MYDEAWQILERAWDVYEQALGVDAILEPTVYCWYLQSSLGTLLPLGRSVGEFQPEWAHPTCGLVD